MSRKRIALGELGAHLIGGQQSGIVVLLRESSNILIRQ